ncbi:putative transcriptional regulator [Listeria aquatica FSL S10-1188]|uniref:Putative transcriptional regulator n=1 Tax=Listeria aquatica FSL S10-1188 TaxID=1265818 RepID=W7B4Z6_9LIST|nr:putative transcriptional regulator [Listeria aquatica FSL S10-1188]
MGDYQVMIFNNRIVMLIKTKQLIEAERESKRFYEFLEQQEQIEETFFHAYYALSSGYCAFRETVRTLIISHSKTRTCS